MKSNNRKQEFNNNSMNRYTENLKIIISAYVYPKSCLHELCVYVYLMLANKTSKQ